MAAVRASGVCIALLSRMTAVLAQLDADDDDEAVMGYEGDDPAEPPSNSTKGSATITIVLLVGGAVLVTLVIFAVYTYTFPSHSQPSSDIILSPLECGRTTGNVICIPLPNSAWDSRPGGGPGWAGTAEICG